MPKKNIRTACAICGLTKGLEIDHVNETHWDNSTRGNLMTLCKFHHMEKSRMGRDLFKTFIQLVRTNPEIKKKTRQTAEKWLLKKENLKSCGYQLELPIDRCE